MLAPLSGVLTPLGRASNRNYQDVVLGTQSASLIAYWPLTETSGSAITNVAASGSTRNGAYMNNPTLANTAGAGGSMGSAPRFNEGLSQWGDLFTASLASAFSLSEGTLAIWVKVFNSSVWTNGLLMWFIEASRDISNRVGLIKDSTSNRAIVQYIAGGTNDSVTPTVSTTNWVHFAMTWSKAADQEIAYIDGVASGNLGTLGSPVVPISSARLARVGEWHGGGFYFNGWLHHAAIWNTALTASEVATIATAI